MSSVLFVRLVRHAISQLPPKRAQSALAADLSAGSVYGGTRAILSRSVVSASGRAQPKVLGAHGATDACLMADCGVSLCLSKSNRLGRCSLAVEEPLAHTY
ncbi:hypothetical protein Q8A67_024248 [Cirrhinus molitorella]|uniref:Uncharacterized protein n=1 Tax=Cirrhinus molitorella TaxID=172907 RepID=A0AA88NY64_9TELE|nr:hypothetical protein Q8A67_024248 [Cirrhinus molitorella]